MDPLLEEIDTLLGYGDPDLGAVLRRCLRAFGAELGTLHAWDAGAGVLRLRADHALPPVVREKVLAVPLGKGMAGLAAERREAVQVCNLQQDAGGVARPGAKATGMEGAIAVPLLDSQGVLRGVIGLAQATPREWSEEERERCLRVGRRIADALARSSDG